jgi:hypothetical protein
MTQDAEPDFYFYFYFLLTVGWKDPQVEAD